MTDLTSNSAAVGPQMRFIRPSDHRAPEDYPEWLQADARLYTAERSTARRHRLAVAAAIAGVVVLVVLSIPAWRTLLPTVPAWEFTDRDLHAAH